MDPFDRGAMEVILPVDMSWIWGVITFHGWKVAGEHWRVEHACYEQVKALLGERRPEKKALPKLMNKCIQLVCRRSLAANEDAKRREVIEAQKMKRADLRVDAITYLLSRLSL
jgi:hypothetical protein